MFWPMILHPTYYPSPLHALAKVGTKFLASPTLIINRGFSVMLGGQVWVGAQRTDLCQIHGIGMSARASSS